MYFHEKISNLDELKKFYKKLALKHHPDRGGCTEVMKKINNEYEILFNKLKKEFNDDPKNYYKKNETFDMFRDLLDKIIRLDINIEVCGSWVWIQSERQFKDILKECGCRWSRNKQRWYWRAEKYKSRNRGNYSMDDIRGKWGSKKVDNDDKDPKLKK